MQKGGMGSWREGLWSATKSCGRDVDRIRLFRRGTTEHRYWGCTGVYVQEVLDTYLYVWYM